MVWKETKINSWKELVQWIDVMKSKKMVYRGQPNYNWFLETSFKRELGLVTGLQKQNETTELMLIRLEKRIIELFKSQYHLYSNPGDRYEGSDLQILSFLQHYGAPTRLLDWSYSPFISTFFAINSNFNSDASLFAIDLEYINQLNEIKIEEYNSRTNPGKRTVDILEYGQYYADFKARYESKGQDFEEKIILTSYEPEKKNIRLARQQGLFLVSSKIDVTFEDIIESYGINMGSSSTMDDIAIKFIIDKDIKMELINNLQMMNISNEILFPEMEGYCKSLKYKLLQDNYIN